VLASGQTLALNSDGWPSPNGLTVRLTLACPAGMPGGCHGAPLQLTLGSAGDAARFFTSPVPISGNGCTVDENALRSASALSFTNFVWRCQDGASTGMDLNPGSRRSPCLVHRRTRPCSASASWGTASARTPERRPGGHCVVIGHPQTCPPPS
jgi:hypothetical protein